MSALCLLSLKMNFIPWEAIDFPRSKKIQKNNRSSGYVKHNEKT